MAGYKHMEESKFVSEDQLRLSGRVVPHQTVE